VIGRAAALVALILATGARADEGAVFEALGTNEAGALVYQVSGVGDASGLAFAVISAAPAEPGPPRAVAVADEADDIETVAAARSLAAARGFEALAALGSARATPPAAWPSVGLREIASPVDEGCDAILGRPATDAVVVLDGAPTPPIAASTGLAAACPASFALHAIVEAASGERWAVIAAILPTRQTAFRALRLP
jgi:hypothetical protein